MDVLLQTEGRPRRRWRLGLFLIAIAGVLAAGAVLARVQPAETAVAAGGLCRSALHREIGSEIPTTVGEIRRWGTGLAGEYPAAHAFATASDASPGAWCWVYTDSAWALFGVAEDGTAVAFPKIAGGPDEVPTSPAAYR